MNSGYTLQGKDKGVKLICLELVCCSVKDMRNFDEVSRALRPAIASKQVRHDTDKF